MSTSTFPGQELGLTLKQARVVTLSKRLVKLGNLIALDTLSDRQRLALAALGWKGPALTASAIRGAAPAIRAALQVIPGPDGTLAALALHEAACEASRALDSALAILAQSAPAIAA